MNIDEIIASLYVLPEHSQNALKARIEQITYPKGHVLLKANCIEKYIYFIKRGVVRAYAATLNGQVTFWFGIEGAPVLSMNSYISEEKSYESIELLEDCDLYKINISELRALYEKDVHLANWGRKLAEQELVKTEERLIAMQFKTAQERYADLVNNHPELLQRVQLGHIASYLGMSQVSLSRIRAGQQ
ncbi:Crp/Fnr family transcriptional regulator [Pedobacter sp.]|uniref:Crp/Fnr family transcriptional regulator n=1 Tax=Pedobacter sp. TaxID=1411316 RepID=UPI003D7F6469